MLADANGFVEAMKRAARNERESSKPVNVCFGEVVSAAPLKIRVEQKMERGEAQLILTRNVTDFVTKVSVNWETENKEGGTGEEAYEKHKHQILGQKQIIIHNALEAGDEVILIRQQEGQKFVVVDRIGGKS